MENNSSNNRENDEENEYILEEIDMAMVVAMQPAKGLDSDDSDEGISDSDTDDDEVRIFWNIPYTECLFLNY